MSSTTTELGLAVLFGLLLSPFMLVFFHTQAPSSVPVMHLVSCQPYPPGPSWEELMSCPSVYYPLRYCPLNVTEIDDLAQIIDQFLTE